MQTSQGTLCGFSNAFEMDASACERPIDGRGLPHCVHCCLMCVFRLSNWIRLCAFSRNYAVNGNPASVSGVVAVPVVNVWRLLSFNCTALAEVRNFRPTTFGVIEKRTECGHIECKSCTQRKNNAGFGMNIWLAFFLAALPHQIELNHEHGNMLRKLRRTFSSVAKLRSIRETSHVCAVQGMLYTQIKRKSGMKRKYFAIPVCSF